MSFTFTPNQWIGSTGLFVVEFEFAGAVRRYCAGKSGEAVLIEDGSQTLFIPSGISDMRFTESIDILSPETIEDNIVSLQLETGLDLLQLFSRGISLEGVKADFYLLLQSSDGTVNQTWQQKIKLYSGVIQRPIFGDPDLADDIVSFSIEQEPFDTDRLMLEQNFIDVRFADRDVDTADGKVFPIVFGDPGRNIRDADGYLTSYPAFPVYCIDKYSGVGTEASFLFAAHDVGATQVLLIDENFSNATDTVIFDADLYGRQYSYTSVPIGPGLALPGTTINGTSQEWWGRFATDGGGIKNPYRQGEPLQNAGDVLRWAMSLTGQAVDEGAFANVSNILNRYSLAGYINDPKINAWEWVSGNILPLLPVSIRSGSKGLKPIINALWALDLVKPIASIELGRDKLCQQISPIRTTRATSDIINDLTLSWGKNGLTQEYAQTSRCKNIAIDPQDIESTYAQLSQSRYGVKPANIETDYVYDRDTADLIAKDLLRANCLPVMEIDIETPIQYGYLQIGDPIAVTSDFLHLANHKMLVVSKQWEINQKTWIFTLQFELNPIQNQRSYDA